MRFRWATWRRTTALVMVLALVQAGSPPVEAVEGPSEPRIAGASGPDSYRAVVLDSEEGTSVMPGGVDSLESTTTDSTTGVFAVQQVWVGDWSLPPNQPAPPRDPPVFSQGEPIMYYARFHYTDNNGPDVWEGATLSWSVHGPCGSIENYSEIRVFDGSGTRTFGLPGSVPQSACPGAYTYTFRVTWDAGSQTSFLSTELTVTGFYLVDPVDLFGRRSQSAYASDPVNTASGNFIQEEIDLSFPHPVFGVDWGRWYNSADDTVGPLGRGWKVGHGIEVLGEDVEGAVTIRLGDGRQVLFEPDGSGGYLRPDDFYGTLIKETAGSFRVDLFDGSSWDFDTSGRLVSISSWEGQSVTFTYGVNGLETVTSSTGASVAVTYDAAGRIIGAAASDGREVVYGYDEAGLLATVIDPEGGVTTHEYDPGGRLTEITDPEGALVVRNVYDSLHRVSSQEMAGGVVATFNYEFGPGETRVVSQPGSEVTVYRHDNQGRIVGIVDAFGNEVEISRRADGELTGATSRLGEALTQTFDERGNLLSSGTTTGGTSSYTYDTANRLTSVTDPSGSTTTYGYDGSERIPDAVTDHAGSVTSLVVTDGLVESVTDPDGVTTTFTYNSQRLLVAETDGVGNTTTYGHDAAGRVTSVTTPEGSVTSYAYDAQDRLLSSMDPTGGATTYTYDSAGRLVTVTDPGDATSTHTYDAAGRLATTTDPRGAVTTYGYDVFDQLTSTTRPGGSTTTSVYGELGRLLSTTDPVGRTTSYGFDADGNQITVTDPLGNVTTTTRDSGGRVVSVTDPLGRTTTNSYDSSGRLGTTTDPEGGVTTYTYDTLGRTETVTDPRGGVTTTTYTPGGKVATVTDANGLVTAYTYDIAGRVATVTDPGGGITTYGYDADGNRTSVTTPDGLTTTTSYNPAGRPLVVTDPDGVSVTFTYDTRGNVATTQRDGDGTVTFTYNDRDLVDVTDAIGNPTTFGYDHRGNRTNLTDTLGRTSTATFNTADQITSVTDPLGRTTTTSYDDAGRIQTVTDPSGRTTTTSYDTAGQVTSQTFADGTIVTYSYDNAGRRTSMTDPSGTTTYAYDPAGNLTTITHPSGDTLSYTFDPSGRRTQITYPDDSTVTYTYNNLGQVTQAAHSTGATATYTYDPDGRLTSETLPGGTTRSYTYANGRLTSYTQNGVATTISYDASGRITSTSGGENWTFAYDQAGQLVSATRGADNYGYGYDPVGNLTSITDPFGSQAFTVDDANQLATNSDGDGYKYDNAGRLVHWAKANGDHHFYRYDARGLLVGEQIIDLCSTLTPTIVGTTGNDNIIGTSGDDIIFAIAGNNTIDGRQGNDIICGGTGNDIIDGGRGGQSGHDLIFAGGGNNTLKGGAGNDILIGGPGDDNLQGEQGNDILAGGPGVNTLDGGQHVDSCSDDPGAVNCQNPLPFPLPIAGTTVISRSYSGDGLLTGITITHPDTTTDTYSLLWDTNQPIPQIVAFTHNGTTTSLVYAPNRAFSVQGGIATSYQYSVLGDTIAGSHTLTSDFDPYGNPTTPNTTVGFGYRGELHVGEHLYLRFRNLEPKLGRFLTPDPAPGRPGTPTLTNRYAYADNSPIQLMDPLGLRAEDKDAKRWNKGDRVPDPAFVGAPIAPPAVPPSGIPAPPTVPLILNPFTIGLGILLGLTWWDSQPERERPRQVKAQIEFWEKPYGFGYQKWEACKRGNDRACEVDFVIYRTTTWGGANGRFWTPHNPYDLQFWPCGPDFCGIMEALALPPWNVYDLVIAAILRDLNALDEPPSKTERKLWDDPRAGPYNGTWAGGGAIEFIIIGGCARDPRELICTRFQAVNPPFWPRP